MMKKMRLFRRITATAMVFAMVGITSAFAASSESYGSMTNGKREIDHIILNDVLPEEEKLSTKSSASPDTEMVISDSPTNGNGEIKHIIVIDSEVMPLATYKDYELPANTAVFFAGESVTSAKMSVEYMPTNLDLYYGLGTKPDGSGTHYANRATGGSGSTTIRPSKTTFLYPYLANGNSKTMYVDFSYTITTAVRAAQENDEGTIMPLANLSMAFSNLGPGKFITSDETYYINDADSILTIESMTWKPASQDIRVGWYNVKTGDAVYTLCTDGDVSNRRLNSSRLDKGDYKIYIKNVGDQSVTGALQYEVS